MHHLDRNLSIFFTIRFHLGKNKICCWFISSDAEYKEKFFVSMPAGWLRTWREDFCKICLLSHAATTSSSLCFFYHDFHKFLSNKLLAFRDLTFFLFFCFFSALEMPDAADWKRRKKTISKTKVLRRRNSFVERQKNAWKIAPSRNWYETATTDRVIYLARTWTNSVAQMRREKVVEKLHKKFLRCKNTA